ncbi:MAG: hypothetical protein JSS81_27340, partial [Acidobacteria bacterium]|nr:hypothetical protein [Acidobacteriota bacterium]
VVRRLVERTISIVAWTPKSKGENIHKAGSRMNRAFYLDYSFTMTGVYADQYIRERCENGSPYGTDFVMFCMGSVLRTEHSDQHALNEALDCCPDYLREHFAKQAEIRSEFLRERDYFDYLSAKLVREW